jgi:transcriptional regulator with XRE-family HTH domain
VAGARKPPATLPDLQLPPVTQPGLGERLRVLRTERRLSLSAVADGTGISPSFLSLVEKGSSDITIGRLVRLVAFYGVRVTDLIPDTEHREALVVRSGEQRQLYSRAEGLSVHLLTPDTERAMMPVAAEFAPGGESAEFSSHPGEEFIHVLEGIIRVEIEGFDPIILEPGDTAYYRSDRPHKLANGGAVPARFLGAVAPPNW